MPGRKTVEVTGDFSATQYVSTEVFPEDALCSGEVTGVDIRLDATDSNATSVTLYGVTNGDDLEDKPAQEYIVFETSSVTLTASATDASLSSMFDNPVDFSDGLRVGGEVVGTGAFKLHVTVHYRDERKNR